ncbi:hypothetical protein OF83DRAFT_1046213, partial [Amylostereum chailletii]
ADRSERTRNAKAQAKHRAKRKAYIEQLERAVAKLQTAAKFALPPDQVTALPPLSDRICQLEQENAMLHRELEDTQRQLRQAQIRSPPIVANESSSDPCQDACQSPISSDVVDHFNRNHKRRRTS